MKKTRIYAGKAYPSCATDIGASSLKVSERIAGVRALTENSPYLLVRGSVAICLAFTGARKHRLFPDQNAMGKPR